MAEQPIVADADLRRYFAQAWPELQAAGLYQPWPNPTFHNPDWADAAWRVLIVRLSPFRDAERSTPHLFLAQAVRHALPDAYVDLAFLPPAADRERFTAAGVPWLTGLQSCRAAADFDAVLISNSYTLELLNLPALLRHSGIPLWASERGPEWPPFILGGSNAFAAQAVVKPDAEALVDAIFFGEGEGAVEKLVRALARHRAVPRRERLQKAARTVKSLWVTGAWPTKSVRRAMAADFASEPGLTDYPLLSGSAAGTGRLQISQGCPAFCSFCAEGYDRKPYREVPRDRLLDTARDLQRRQGCRELEIYSFNFNTHSDIPALLLELNRLFDRVSCMSQRLDFLAWYPRLLDGEVAAGKSSFTLGIEGISERLRSFLHKSLETAAITKVLEQLFHLRVRELKLFYIITGHEKSADVEEFRAFVAALRALRKRLNPGLRVLFSLGYLVRLPGTPLQYDRLYVDPAEWRQLAGPLKNVCDTLGFECRFAMEWHEYAVTQVLALGGYWLHEPLLALVAQDIIYDETLPPAAWEQLEPWLREHGHLDGDFVRTKAATHEFPFAFVEGGVRREFLYEQFLACKEKSDEGYCLGADTAPGGCLGCGACPDAATREAIVAHRLHQSPDLAWVAQVRAQTQVKSRLAPCYLRVRLPAECGGTTYAWTNARLFQALLAVQPQLQGNLLAVEECLWSMLFPREDSLPATGETVMACKAWDAAALVGLLGAGQGIDAAGALPLEPRWGAVADGYEPGTLVSGELRMRVPTTDSVAAARAFAEFLRREALAFILHRDGDGYTLEIPDKSRKRRVLLAGRYLQTPEALDLTLTAGPKLDLPALLRALAGPRWRTVTTDVASLRLPTDG